MTLVHVSYSYETSEFVERLVHDLQAGGLQVFYDKMLLPGERWETVLANNVRRADYVLVILSGGYIQGRGTRELEMALQREQDEGVVRVIPVRAQDSEVPPSLAAKVWVDFRNEEDYERKLEELLRAMRRQGAIQLPVEVPSENGVLAIQFALPVVTSHRIRELGDFLLTLDKMCSKLVSVSDLGYATSVAARCADGIPMRSIQLASPLSIKLDIGAADLVNALRELIKDLWYRNAAEKQLAHREVQKADREVLKADLELVDRLVDLVSKRDRQLTKYERNAIAIEILPLMNEVREQALLEFIEGI